MINFKAFLDATEQLDLLDEDLLQPKEKTSEDQQKEDSTFKEFLKVIYMSQ